MEYTITFTPQSVSEYLELPVEFVEENWEQFENYLEHFQYNWMNDTLWEDFSSNAETWEIELPDEEE